MNQIITINARTAMLDIFVGHAYILFTKPNLKVIFKQDAIIKRNYILRFGNKLMRNHFKGGGSNKFYGIFHK